jgi:hypothetical protein
MLPLRRHPSAPTPCAAPAHPRAWRLALLGALAGLACAMAFPLLAPGVGRAATAADTAPDGSAAPAGAAAPASVSVSSVIEPAAAAGVGPAPVRAQGRP